MHKVDFYPQYPYRFYFGIVSVCPKHMISDFICRGQKQRPLLHNIRVVRSCGSVGRAFDCGAVQLIR